MMLSTPTPMQLAGGLVSLALLVASHGHAQVDDAATPGSLPTTDEAVVTGGLEAATVASPPAAVPAVTEPTAPQPVSPAPVSEPVQAATTEPAAAAVATPSDRTESTASTGSSGPTELPLPEFEEAVDGSTDSGEGRGRWSGDFNASLGYFWEASTRVDLPGAGINVVSPSGWRLSAGYSVDVITSASISFGVAADELHQELRHEPSIGVAKEFELAEDEHLDVQLDSRVSVEPDYQSLSMSSQLAWSTHQRNTIPRLGVSVNRDTIRQNNIASVEKRLHAVSVVAGVERVLNRYMVISGAYQIGHAWGFLGNVYRTVQIQAAPQPEAPPDNRTRHGMSVRWQGILPSSGTALHLMAKVYADDWGIVEASPEVRLYQSVGEALLARARYRYYSQNRADFHRDAYERGWERGTTADPKLASFDGHMVGLRLDVFPKFLGDTFLAFAQGGSVYLTFDSQITGISFGDAYVGSAGGSLPF